MRVLIVNTVYKRGGAAGIAQTLHQELNRLDGWESLFAFGRGPKVEELGTVRFALQPEVYLHVALTRFTGLQGYGTWLSTKRLIRLIKRWKPDVIHFHNIHGYYLNLSVAKAVDKLGIPIVWTLHDAWPLTGKCTYFIDCEKWRRGCGGCMYLREFPKTYLDSSAWMWSRKRRLLGKIWKPVIVSPSRWLASLVGSACGSRCPINVIPNGVDTNVFSPLIQKEVRKELGLPLDKKIVLFASVKPYVKRKGIQYLFDAFKYVKVNNCMVVTVGKIMDEKRWFLHRIKLKQFGYIKGNQAMAKIYNAADLYCITSLAENFPTTVLESMACGTPVVGFEVGGIPEQVSKSCGELVGYGDTRALGRAITDLLNNDVLRKEMAYCCRDRVKREFSLDLFIKRHLELYRNLLIKRTKYIL